MNREIKFRVWEKVQKIMLFHGFTLSSNGSISFYWNEKPIHSAHAVLMQYTGLKDKNKTEIYEGDIVTYGKRLYEVAINFNGYYLQRYKLWRGEFKPSFQYSMSLITLPFKKGDRGENGGIVDSAEVVGNIYENPELVLKEPDAQKTGTTSE